MPSKKSGGRRAVEKKHAERNAERKRSAGGRKWRKVWLEDLQDLEQDAPKTAAEGFRWLGRAAIKVVRATLRDTGLPFEQLRRDAMRQIEQAAKVLNPARMSEELAELEHALQQVHHAGDVDPRANRPPSPPAPLS